MELVSRIAMLCVVGAVMTLVLKKNSQEMALLLTLIISVTVLLFLLGEVQELFAFFRKLGECSGIAGTLLTPLYKTAGIALIVKIGSGLCRDAGESALSAVVETAGSVCAFLAALPLMQTVLDALMELIK